MKALTDIVNQYRQIPAHKHNLHAKNIPQQLERQFPDVVALIMQALANRRNNLVDHGLPYRLVAFTVQ